MGGGSNGTYHSWSNKYGFVHVGTAGNYEGMNEKGLTISPLALHLSQYQQPVYGTPSVSKNDLQLYILGNFATVREATAALEHSVRVVDDDGGKHHYGMHDDHESVVIEYLRGGVQIHNNSNVGVITNDPSWDWQVQNLNNYVGLSPNWPSANQQVAVEVEDHQYYPWQSNAYQPGPPMVPAATGHGFNLLGLPGDSSPSSRFVRAFFLRQYALLHTPPVGLNGTMILAQELLNALTVVLGSAASVSSDEHSFETTTYAVIKVPHMQRLLFRSRSDLTWKQIELAQMNFSKGSSLSSVVIADGRFAASDITVAFS
jgi:choloylglycine hydrolase